MFMIFDDVRRLSRTYGRVYYANHSLLLFYAFDLDQSAKGRKPVAFQAWGFRRSDSKTAESLGLFYLEDPKVDRWTLRVTDVNPPVPDRHPVCDRRVARRKYCAQGPPDSFGLTRGTAQPSLNSSS